MHLFTAPLLFLLLLLTPLTADAEQRTILLGALPEGWPPYQIIPKDRKEPYGGIMIDVMNEVCRANGYVCKIRLSPEKRSHFLLARHDIDAYTEAREWIDDPENYLWSDPVLPSDDVLVFLKDKPIEFGTVDDLCGLSIAAPLGYVYPELEPCFAKGNVLRQSPTDTLGSLRMVNAGHADAAVANQLVAQWLIAHNRDLKAENFAYSERKVGSADYRFVFVDTLKMRKFQEVFNRELALMRKDGRFQQILDTYR